MSIQAESAVVPVFDVADRMRKALRESDVGVQEMADYLEVSRSAVGKWINGHITPSAQTVRLWALRTGVPYEWLRDGTSPRTDWGPGGGVESPERDSNPQPTVLWPRVAAWGGAGAA